MTPQPEGAECSEPYETKKLTEGTTTATCTDTFSDKTALITQNDTSSECVTFLRPVIPVVPAPKS